MSKPAPTTRKRNAARGASTTKRPARAQGQRRRGRSKFERTIIDKAGLWHAYEVATLLYRQERRYTPDLWLGGDDYIEIKGLFTSADRTKTLLVKRDNPRVRIRFLFMRNNPLRRGSKTSYTDWCDKNGFEWHIGTSIPKSWLREDYSE